MVCAKFGRNWLSGTGEFEEIENVKSVQTDGRTDRRTPNEKRSKKLTCAFTSYELEKRNVFNIVYTLD